MKKKIFALILAMIMSCAVVACGSVSSEDMTAKEAGGNAANGTGETVEITLDNWQEYFEIIDRPQVEYDAFDEIEMLYVTKQFVIKEEYADKLVDCTVAVGFVPQNEQNYTATYDAATEEFTLNASENDEIIVPEEFEGNDTAEVTKEDVLSGYQLLCGGTYTDSVEVSEDGKRVAIRCWSYSTVEIDRIKGSIVIAK